MKRMTIFVFVLCMGILLSGCGDAKDQYTFKGTVLEINENSILMEPLEGEGILKSSDRISIGIKDIELPENLLGGDIVEVTYSGEVMESYPAQISDIISIKIVTDPVEPRVDNEDSIPMVMINKVLYYNTGDESDLEGRCGVMDGEITSTVEITEIPKKDDQSNFGEGYEYQIVGKDDIDVVIEGKWMRFKKMINNFDGVSMEIISGSSTSIKLEILNTVDLDIQFGEDYDLQILQNGRWEGLPYLIENWGFNSIAYMAPKDQPIIWEVDWTVFHGELLPGTYRIVKSIMDFRETGDYTNYYLDAQFTIDENNSFRKIDPVG